MEIISEDEFVDRYVAQNAPLPDHSHIRAAGNTSGINLRRAQARHLADIQAVGRAQAAARQEYARLVAAGMVRPPTRLEYLTKKAQGHPDNPGVQAARRLLEKELGK